jgi:hypothetical protein
MKLVISPLVSYSGRLETLQEKLEFLKKTQPRIPKQKLAHAEKIAEVEKQIADLAAVKPKVKTVRVPKEPKAKVPSAGKAPAKAVVPAAPAKKIRVIVAKPAEMSIPDIVLMLKEWKRSDVFVRAEDVRLVTEGLFYEANKPIFGHRNMAERLAKELAPYNAQLERTPLLADDKKFLRSVQAVKDNWLNTSIKRALYGTGANFDTVRASVRNIIKAGIVKLALKET